MNKNNLRKVTIDVNQFLELYNQGLYDKDISNIMQVKYWKVFNCRNYLDLPPNSKYDDIKLTNIEKGVLIGHILGDGNLNKSKTSKYARGKIEQSYKQYEYFLWKFNHLYKLHNNKFNIVDRFDARTSKIYKTVYSHFRTNPLLEYYYNITYKGKKVISKELLKDFNDISLATLFMDDGYKVAHSYGIATNCFDLDSIENLRNLLYYKYNIETTIQSENRLYILKQSKEVFESIILPYIIPSMLYKINVPYKLGEFMETPEVDNHELSANLND